MQEPIQIKIRVRKPADLLRYSRSAPIMLPIKRAANNFIMSGGMAKGIIKDYLYHFVLYQNQNLLDYYHLS